MTIHILFISCSSFSNNEIQEMNTYSQYIEIFNYNRWQHIVNIFKQFMVNYISRTDAVHLAYSKKMIVDVLLLPMAILYPYKFPTFTYDFSRAWHRNSVGHIIKFLTIFSIFWWECHQIVYFFKHILIVMAPLHLQRHTTFTHYNSMQCTPSMFVIFYVQS